MENYNYRRDRGGAGNGGGENGGFKDPENEIVPAEFFNTASKDAELVPTDNREIHVLKEYPIGPEPEEQTSKYTYINANYQLPQTDLIDVSNDPWVNKKVTRFDGSNNDFTADPAIGVRPELPEFERKPFIPKRHIDSFTEIVPSRGGEAVPYNTTRYTDDADDDGDGKNKTFALPPSPDGYRLEEIPWKDPNKNNRDSRLDGLPPPWADDRPEPRISEPKPDTWKNHYPDRQIPPNVVSRDQEPDGNPDPNLQAPRSEFTNIPPRRPEYELPSTSLQPPAPNVDIGVPEPRTRPLDRIPTNNPQTPVSPPPIPLQVQQPPTAPPAKLPLNSPKLEIGSPPKGPPKPPPKDGATPPPREPRRNHLGDAIGGALNLPGTGARSVVNASDVAIDTYRDIGGVLAGQAGKIAKVATNVVKGTGELAGNIGEGLVGGLNINVEAVKQAVKLTGDALHLGYEVGKVAVDFGAHTIKTINGGANIYREDVLPVVAKIANPIGNGLGRAVGLTIIPAKFIIETPGAVVDGVGKLINWANNALSPGWIRNEAIDKYKYRIEDIEKYNSDIARYKSSIAESAQALGLSEDELSSIQDKLTALDYKLNGISANIDPIHQKLVDTLKGFPEGVKLDGLKEYYNQAVDAYDIGVNQYKKDLATVAKGYRDLAKALEKQVKEQVKQAKKQTEFQRVQNLPVPEREPHPIASVINIFRGKPTQTQSSQGQDDKIYGDPYQAARRGASSINNPELKPATPLGYAKIDPDEFRILYERGPRPATKVKIVSPEGGNNVIDKYPNRNKIPLKYHRFALWDESPLYTVFKPPLDALRDIQTNPNSVLARFMDKDDKVVMSKIWEDLTKSNNVGSFIAGQHSKNLLLQAYNVVGYEPSVSQYDKSIKTTEEALQRLYDLIYQKPYKNDQHPNEKLPKLSWPGYVFGKPKLSENFRKALCADIAAKTVQQNEPTPPPINSNQPSYPADSAESQKQQSRFTDTPDFANAGNGGDGGGKPPKNKATPPNPSNDSSGAQKSSMYEDTTAGAGKSRADTNYERLTQLAKNQAQTVVYSASRPYAISDAQKDKIRFDSLTQDQVNLSDLVIFADIGEAIYAIEKELKNGQSANQELLNANGTLISQLFSQIRPKEKDTTTDRLTKEEQKLVEDAGQVIDKLQNAMQSPNNDEEQEIFEYAGGDTSVPHSFDPNNEFLDVLKPNLDTFIPSSQETGTLAGNADKNINIAAATNTNADFTKGRDSNDTPEPEAVVVNDLENASDKILRRYARDIANAEPLPGVSKDSKLIDIVNSATAQSQAENSSIIKSAATVLHDIKQIREEQSDAKGGEKFLNDIVGWMKLQTGKDLDTFKTQTEIEDFLKTFNPVDLVGFLEVIDQRLPNNFKEEFAKYRSDLENSVLNNPSVERALFTQFQTPAISERISNLLKVKLDFTSFLKALEGHSVEYMTEYLHDYFETIFENSEDLTLADFLSHVDSNEIFYHSKDDTLFSGQTLDNISSKLRLDSLRKYLKDVFVPLFIDTVKNIPKTYDTEGFAPIQSQFTKIFPHIIETPSEWGILYRASQTRFFNPTLELDIESSADNLLDRLWEKANSDLDAKIMYSLMTQVNDKNPEIIRDGNQVKLVLSSGESQISEQQILKDFAQIIQKEFNLFKYKVTLDDVKIANHGYMEQMLTFDTNIDDIDLSINILKDKLQQRLASAEDRIQLVNLIESREQEEKKRSALEAAFLKSKRVQADKIGNFVSDPKRVVNRALEYFNLIKEDFISNQQ